MPTADLTKPLSESRTDIVRGLKHLTDENTPRVARDGGDDGAGLIRGVAVNTLGEALGHQMWLDSTFIDQVLAAMRGEAMKARFTHPGLSSDGMGKFLGRFKNPFRDGDIVRADLHLSETAHKAPDGDLADYVMGLAEADPDAFGTSIVFMHDPEAEEAFENEHMETYEYEDYRGRTRTNQRFKSPDAGNEHNYYHARLAELRAVDVVDEPAANPSGLFGRGQEIAAEAEALLSYAVGLSSDRPTVAALSIDPDRASRFVRSFLQRHGLELARTNTEDDMAKDTQQPDEGDEGSELSTETPVTTEPAKPDALKEFRAELGRFTKAFGAENGVKWFNAGLDYSEALELHCDAINEALTAATEQIATLEERIASLDLGGENEGVESFESNDEHGDKATTKKRASNLAPGTAKYAASLKMPK